MSNKSSKIRQVVAKKNSWLTAMAAVALVVAMAAGCKHQQGAQAARTDQQIAGDIQAKIQGESALASQNIQVSVANGVATLNGTVGDDASRALAANDSGTVAGVKTVVNNLTVQPAQQTSIAPAVAEAPRKEARNERSSQQQARYVPQPQPQPQPAPQQPVRSAPPAPVQAAAPVAPPRPVVQQITLEAGTVV
ncbi:MAG: BON domain-containing protein, partial [Acidobacteriaceae bacterium]|nr:BON domain-containing protein [Acidobacteriaceae bacterium]